MLEIRNVSKSIKERKIISDISFNVNYGEIFGLLGPNGAGKTSTFYIIAGLINADKGNVILEKEDITTMPMHLRSNLGLKYLPQEPSIFRNLNVRDNIMAILETRKHLSLKQRQIKLDSLVSTLQIENILHSNGASLSGGERRRVEIARALAIEPKFLLLDEPFAGIDPISIIEIQKIIKDLINADIGVLITDHNVRETLKVCDESYIISDGKVIAHGKPSEIVKDKIVQSVYLGDNFKL